MADLRPSAGRNGRAPGASEWAARALPHVRRCRGICQRDEEARRFMQCGDGSGLGAPDRGDAARRRQARGLPTAPRSSPVKIIVPVSKRMDTWMSQPATPAARAELAPSGKLRVGINHSNFLLVKPGAPCGEPDLAAELAKRLGVPVEYVSFDSAGKTADAIRDAAVDAGFIANEAERANVIAFSSAYLELPATY